MGSLSLLKIASEFADSYVYSGFFNFLWTDHLTQCNDIEAP